MEAIHETCRTSDMLISNRSLCRTHECTEFSRKFTKYLKLLYANRKSENLTDNQQLYATYTYRIVTYLR